MMCSRGHVHGTRAGESLETLVHFQIVYGLRCLFKNTLCRAYSFLLSRDINGLPGLQTAFLISYKYPLQSNLPDFDGWHSERTSGPHRGTNGSGHSHPWLFALLRALLFMPKWKQMVCLLLLRALPAAFCRMKVVFKCIFLLIKNLLWRHPMILKIQWAFNSLPPGCWSEEKCGRLAAHYPIRFLTWTSSHFHSNFP